MHRCAGGRRSVFETAGGCVSLAHKPHARVTCLVGLGRSPVRSWEETPQVPGTCRVRGPAGCKFRGFVASGRRAGCKFRGLAVCGVLRAARSRTLRPADRGGAVGPPFCAQFPGSWRETPQIRGFSHQDLRRRGRRAEGGSPVGLASTEFTGLRASGRPAREFRTVVASGAPQAARCGDLSRAGSCGAHLDSAPDQHFWR